jgi:hypothetical protein
MLDEDEALELLAYPDAAARTQVDEATVVRKVAVHQSGLEDLLVSDDTRLEIPRGKGEVVQSADGRRSVHPSLTLENREPATATHGRSRLQGIREY